MATNCCSSSINNLQEEGEEEEEEGRGGSSSPSNLDFDFSVVHSGTNTEDKEEEAMVPADELFHNGHLLPLYQNYYHYYYYDSQGGHQQDQAIAQLASIGRDRKTIDVEEPLVTPAITIASAENSTKSTSSSSKWRHIFGLKKKETTTHKSFKSTNFTNPSILNNKNNDKTRDVDVDPSPFSLPVRIMKTGRLSLDGGGGGGVSIMSRAAIFASTFVKGRMSDCSRDSSPSSLSSSSSASSSSVSSSASSRSGSGRLSMKKSLERPIHSHIYSHSGLLRFPKRQDHLLLNP